MKIGVNHEKKECSVEELDNEDSISDETSLLGLGVITNLGNQLDDNKTKEVVDSDDRKLYNLVIDNNTLQVAKVFIANCRVEFRSLLILQIFKSLWGFIIGKTESLIVAIKVRLFSFSLSL